MDIDQVLSGIEDADPTNTGSGGGQKLTVSGQHTTKILSCKIKESEQYSAIYFIVEFEIVETNAEDRGVRPGDVYSWTHDLTNKWYGASTAKAFLAAALGLDAASSEARALGKAEIMEAIGDEQPLSGQIVRLTTTPKTTKGGFDFVVHDWKAA